MYCLRRSSPYIQHSQIQTINLFIALTNLWRNYGGNKLADLSEPSFSVQRPEHRFSFQFLQCMGSTNGELKPSTLLDALYWFSRIGFGWDPNWRWHNKHGCFLSACWVNSYGGGWAESRWAVVWWRLVGLDAPWLHV